MKRWPDAALRALRCRRARRRVQGDPGIELREVVPSRGSRACSPTRAARLAGVPAACARGISSELSRGREPRWRTPGPRAGDRRRPDRRPQRWQRSRRRRPVIYNAHNLESGFRHELTAAGLVRVAATQLRSFERGLLRRRQRIVDGERGRHARRASSCARRHACGLCPTWSTCSDRAGAPGGGASRERYSSRTSPTSPTATGCASCSTEVFPRVWSRAARRPADARRRRLASNRRARTRESRRSASSRISPASTRTRAARSSRCCRAGAHR